eukprot:17229-Heterococcus_DN1.PRE.1
MEHKAQSACCDDDSAHIANTTHTAHAAVKQSATSVARGTHLFDNAFEASCIKPIVLECIHVIKLLLHLLDFHSVSCTDAVLIFLEVAHHDHASTACACSTHSRKRAVSAAIRTIKACCDQVMPWLTRAGLQSAADCSYQTTSRCGRLYARRAHERM